MSDIVFSHPNGQTSYLQKKRVQSQFFCVKNKNSQFIAACGGFSWIAGYKNPIDILGKADYDMRCPASQLFEAWAKEDQNIIRYQSNKSYVCIATYHNNDTKILNYTKEYIGGDIALNFIELSSGPFYHYGQSIINNIPYTKRQHIHLIYEIIHHYDTLTQRESDIVFLLSHQLKAKQIAALLHRSPRTIQHTIDRIRCKLSCEKSSDIIQLAHFLGWKMKIPISLCDRTILTSLMVP